MCSQEQGVRAGDVWDGAGAWWGHRCWSNAGGAVCGSGRWSAFGVWRVDQGAAKQLGSLI